MSTYQGEIADLRRLANDWREECLKAERRLATLRAQVEQLLRYSIDPTWGLSDPIPDGDLLKRADVLALLTREADPEIPRSPSPYDLDAEARLRRQGGRS